MSDYTQITDFSVKDALPSGDPEKIILGSDVDAELDAIATAIASKSDTASPTFTGTVTLPAVTENGTVAKNSRATLVSATGTDTYAASVAASVTSLAAGDVFHLHFSNTNTGAATLNINSIGAKTIVLKSGAALAAGDILGTHFLRYDGTNFVLLDPVVTVRQPEAVRQTVVAGAVDSNGRANFLAAGTGLAVTMTAATTPVVATFAAGEDALGPLNYRARFSANQADYWSSLVASNVSYLMLDRDTGTGIVTAYKTLVPPQYGPAFDKTKQVLLHFDGSDTSTTITDEYGNTWTANGNAQIDTAQFKFGSAALLLDGTTDYISTTDIPTLGGGSWTVEGFYRPAVLPTSGNIHCLFYQGAASGYGLRFQVYNDAGTYKYRLYMSSNGGSDDIANGALSSALTGAAINTWFHWALCYDAVAGKYYFYWDGVKVHEIASTAAVFRSDVFRFGADWDAAASVNGHLDEIRINIGVCRYPAGTTFTVPVSAFSPDAEWFDMSEYKWKYGAPGAFTEKHRVCLGSVTTGAAAVSSVTTYGLRGRYESAITWTLPAGGTHTSFNHNLGVVPLEKKVRLHTRRAEYGFSLFDVTELLANNAGAVTPVSIRVNNTVFGFTNGTTDNALIRKDTGAAVTALTVANYGYSVLCERGW